MSSTKMRKGPLNVTDLVAPMYETHKSTENQTYEWRMSNLRKLRKMHTSHRQEWIEALYKDMGKGAVEADASEVNLNLQEIDYFLSNLKSLMKVKQASSPGYNMFCFSQVEHRPLRAPAVLIIGASNYPLNLTLAVAAGALAGGNPVVIKPSELTPEVSNTLARLADKYFDSGSFQVVEGGKEIVQALLKQEWGKIAFTGSERVGRIIAQDAAKTTTPVLLELGGKSPVYVDEKAPYLRLVAERIIWGKTWNAGQTCVSPDYLLVHESRKDNLVRELQSAILRQFGPDVEKSELGRLVQKEHAERQVKLLKEVEEAGAKIIGGSFRCDTEGKFIFPTLIIDPPRDCRLLREEVFGPCLPIISVKSRGEAQDFINSIDGIPLAMYIFTSSNWVFREMLRKCPAASALRNDTMVHFGNPHLPMGGLGSSGYGNYHGINSWRTFTHAQSQVYRPCYPTADFGLLRYHPYKGMKQFLMLNLLVKIPTCPPLRVRLLLSIAVILCVILKVGNLRFYLADTLEIVVEWLRSPSCTA